MKFKYKPNKFKFNRKYLYYAERKASPLQIDDVIVEIDEWLKHVPPSELFEEQNFVRPAAPRFCNVNDYKNLHEQVFPNYLQDQEESEYESMFLAQYICAFIVCKNYTDDELSYLYTACIEFAENKKYVDGAALLDPKCKYLKSRLKVIYVISYNLWFWICMYLDNENKVFMGKTFDLLDYVGEEMPEEDYNKEQEEYEQ